MDRNIAASLHFYAIDTVVYHHANMFALVFERLQSAADTVQSHLYHLKLVLNANKRKTMWFWNKKNVQAYFPLQLHKAALQSLWPLINIEAS